MRNDLKEPDLREEATMRLRKRRDFAAHLAAYVFVNVSVIVIWAMTGSGFFWPVFPILGWGIGLFSTAGTRSPRRYRMSASSKRWSACDGRTFDSGGRRSRRWGAERPV
jgi:hypothetical protein